MDYGEKLFELRKQLNLSQEEIAHELGVSRQSISLWETNQASPSMDNLILIAKLFHVSLDEIVGIKEITKHNKQMEESIYEIKYIEDKKTIYRRDYQYISSHKDLIKARLSFLFLFFATVALINAINVEIKLARLLIIMADISIIVGLAIYPLSIMIFMHKQAKLKRIFTMQFTKQYMNLEIANALKEQVLYEHIDYLIEKHDYDILFLKDKRRLYLPVQNQQALKNFLSEHIEVRKRRKPLFK